MKLVIRKIRVPMAGLSRYVSGSCENRLSNRGQVAFPARFRQLSADTEGGAATGYVLLPGRERCLYLYAVDEFERMAEQLEAAARKMGREASEFNRRFLEEVYQVEIDSQGRMVIPEVLRNRAGITGDSVLFLGVGRRVELWDPRLRATARMTEERFEQRRAEAGDEIFGL